MPKQKILLPRKRDSHCCYSFDYKKSNIKPNMCQPFISFRINSITLPRKTCAKNSWFTSNTSSGTQALWVDFLCLKANLSFEFLLYCHYLWCTIFLIISFLLKLFCYFKFQKNCLTSMGILVYPWYSQWQDQTVWAIYLVTCNNAIILSEIHMYL